MVSVPLAWPTTVETGVHYGERIMGDLLMKVKFPTDERRVITSALKVAGKRGVSGYTSWQPIGREFHRLSEKNGNANEFVKRMTTAAKVVLSQKENSVETTVAVMA